jgi:hypothetical protein
VGRAEIVNDESDTAQARTGTSISVNNSVALARKRTIPPLVGEVGANFSEWSVSRGQRNGSPRPLISDF